MSKAQMETAAQRPNFCRRCKWKTIRMRPVEIKTTHGHGSGYYGMWEVRECIVCGCKGGRWHPKGGCHKTKREVWGAVRPEE